MARTSGSCSRPATSTTARHTAPVDQALPSDWPAVAGARAHPRGELVACPLGRHARERGVGVWRADGAPVAWFAGALGLAWASAREEAALVFPPVGAEQLVCRVSAPRWEPTGALRVPVDASGCAIEDVTVSGSGRWAATQRSSGQGECGFDVFDLASMERIGGVSDLDGYGPELPAFSEEEGRVVWGCGPWLGGWWAHPDDEPDEPARGGVVDMGRVDEVELASGRHRVCRLELELPAGWLPDDPWAEAWHGPTRLRPAGDGVRMILPGGQTFEHLGALPERLRLPRLQAFG